MSHRLIIVSKSAMRIKNEGNLEATFTVLRVKIVANADNQRELSGWSTHDIEAMSGHY